MDDNQKVYQIPLLQKKLQNILGVSYPEDQDWLSKLRAKRENFDHKNFPVMKNDIILKVFKREKITHLPVWIMRQAGRYLPEFKESRKQCTFFQLCENPLLSVEVTLQPLERFPLDCSIIFSDILVVPQAMGLEVQMIESKGPTFPEPLSTPEDLKRLKTPDLKDLVHVFDSIFLMRHALEGSATLIGFCGAPWTLFTYMIEGSGSKLFSKAKKWIFAWEQDSLNLLNTLTDILVIYMKNIIKSGAQVIQLFDSWAGELGPEDYYKFGLQFCIRIATEVKNEYPDVPIIMFAKGFKDLDMLFKEKCFDCIGIDYGTEISIAKQLSDKYNKVIQGNLDPGVLMGSEEFIRQRTREMIDKVGVERYVVNLGHGMWPDHNPAHLGYFIDEIHQYSKKLIENKQ